MKQTYINFKDCYVDMEPDSRGNLITHPHELNYSPRYQINMTYKNVRQSDSKENHRFIFDFLDSILPNEDEYEDTQGLFLESIGMLLMPDVRNYEPLFVYGSDVKGIRVLFSLIGSMIGFNNVSNLTMAELKPEHQDKLIQEFDSALFNIALWNDEEYDHHSIQRLISWTQSAADARSILPQCVYTKLVFISDKWPQSLSEDEMHYVFNTFQLGEMPQLRDPEFVQSFIKALPYLCKLAMDSASKYYQQDVYYDYLHTKNMTPFCIELPDGNALPLIV